MSQFDFATIDPNAKSGTQLAVDLNNWRDALHSCHRGAERPSYAKGGMLWVRETSSEQWDLMFCDGDADFVLRSVNPTTNQLIGIPQSAVSGLAQVIADFEGNLADKQAADPLLTAIAALVTSADKLLYFTGEDAVAQTTLTAFARTLLDDADDAAMRATLGFPSAPQTMFVQDRKPSGTAGGSLTAGAWRTRDLNTTSVNSIAGASLAANQITLPAGTYRAQAASTSYAGSGTRLRLANITTGTSLVDGSNASNLGTGSLSQPQISLHGVFTLAETTVLELQIRSQASRATDGLGGALSYGDDEIYSSVVIERLFV